MIIVVRTASLPASPAFIAEWDGEAFIPITKPMPYEDARLVHRWFCRKLTANTDAELLYLKHRLGKIVSPAKPPKKFTIPALAMSTIEVTR
jgi:hypothetical protein